MNTIQAAIALGGLLTSRPARKKREPSRIGTAVAAWYLRLLLGENAARYYAARRLAEGELSEWWNAVWVRI